MQKILIIEDDLTIAGALSAHLTRWGYQTKYIEDFQSVMEEFADFSPQMVLMDITLPFFNGFHWCTRIRAVSKVPVIFISSAGDNMNLLMAINMGADDFVAKPFDLDVITAKIQALMRRTYDFQGQTNLISHKGVVLNLNDATMIYKEQKIDLTKNEYRIILTLMEHRGDIVSRDRIMNKLWEDESFVDDNTLTVNITRLRKKLEEAGLMDFITTKKGIGYLVE